jgi:hypothetical protein
MAQLMMVFAIGRSRSPRLLALVFVVKNKRASFIAFSVNPAVKRARYPAIHGSSPLAYCHYRNADISSLDRLSI